MLSLGILLDQSGNINIKTCPRETLNMLNKHATVRPHVNYQMPFMGSANIDTNTRFDINLIVTHFVRSVRKSDNMNCEFIDPLICMSFNS